MDVGFGCLLVGLVTIRVRYLDGTGNRSDGVELGRRTADGAAI